MYIPDPKHFPLVSICCLCVVYMLSSKFLPQMNSCDRSCICVATVCLIRILDMDRWAAATFYSPALQLKISLNIILSDVVTVYS